MKRCGRNRVIAEASREKNRTCIYGLYKRGKGQEGIILEWYLILYSHVVVFFFSECRLLIQPMFRKFALGLCVTLLSMVEKVCTINTSLPSMCTIYLSFSGL